MFANKRDRIRCAGELRILIDDVITGIESPVEFKYIVKDMTQSPDLLSEDVAPVFEEHLRRIAGEMANVELCVFVLSVQEKNEQTVV